MQLLVSVRNAAEAAAALSGGADVIDAKEPAAGALGAVPLEEFRAIAAAVAGKRPISAALGDAVREGAIEHMAREFAECGAAFVKVGFAGFVRAERVASIIMAAVRGVERARTAGARVVAVAYADADRAASIGRDSLVEIAAASDAAGVLLDTFDKQAGGLRDLIGTRELAAWVAAAHDAGLFVALAGKLAATDLRDVREAGADVAGVRGAACDDGRAGRLSVDRVRLLRSACDLRVVPIFS